MFQLELTVKMKLYIQEYIFERKKIAPTAGYNLFSRNA